MSIDNFFPFLAGLTSSDRSAFITGLSTGLVQVLVVFILSFFFPYAQNHYKAKAQRRQDSLERKEKILDEFVASFPRYIANYMMYAKFSSFLVKKDKETYLGLDREKVGELFFKSFSAIVEERQPESMLAYIRAYYDNPQVAAKTKELNDILAKLWEVPFASQKLESECDGHNCVIKNIYEELVMCMTQEIQKDIEA
ncbi:hypothetical protein [Solidesulfovibrio sp.]|uniref:hypothetical protein n=1 Tax=Solidesulfovibrio sp. TaxID=2910990 RepID=UPI00262BD9F3|nr:hypothetical protein [Solidesulfovibrio sp.]